MPAQALYRKWRPQTWDEVVGQKHVVETLRHALAADRVAHAYLFAGPRGCGKTTVARLIAKAVNCLHADPARRPDNTCAHCLAVNDGRFLDLIEIDGASNNSVENVRELRDKINFSPGEGRCKVYIIDEVHMLSIGAFNALLKTLEEPPPHAIFILATTESYKIPPTVASRCQRFEFRRLLAAEIVDRLRELCAREKLEVEVAVLELVARQATGSLRDAIGLLDQLVAAGTSVTLAQAQALLGTAANETVQKLTAALREGDTAAGLNLIGAAVDGGADPRQLARQMVDHLRALLLTRMGSADLVEATIEERQALKRQADSLEVPFLLTAIRACNTAAQEARGGWQPQLPLELALVECTLPIQAGVGQPPVPTAPAVGGRKPPASKLTAKEKEAVTSPADKVAKGNAVAMLPADLKAAWTRLLALVRERDKPTEALLRSCSVAGFDGSVLLLTTNAKLVCEKLNNQPNTRQLIDALLSEVIGKPCSIACQISGGRPTSTKQAMTSTDVPPDGLVATALRDLGGEIVGDE